MRVLLVGATGNVGSRLLASLASNKHEVIVYVRNPSKLSKEATDCATTVIKGSATDSESIKSAILDHNCNALINAAGLAPMLGKSGDLPVIFAAVLKAALNAQDHRGGEPLRCWFMSGFSILDSPVNGQLLMNYLPIFTIHKQNFELIKSIPKEKLAWSLFCANQMNPRSEHINYSSQSDNDTRSLLIGVDSPPDWGKGFLWLPLLGPYLNVLTQASRYMAPLEDCVEVLAKDLNTGLDSNLLGKRVSVKVKS